MLSTASVPRELAWGSTATTPPLQNAKHTTVDMALSPPGQPVQPEEDMSLVATVAIIVASIRAA